MNRVIVVFGGAFNPPTNSHFSLSEQICSEYEEIEKVIFVPVSDKYPKEDLLPAEHRVEMLRKVCEKNNKFSVSTIEVD
ncbi:MAG: adenylyltransferase/cytidyltransferase family protein, partial [Cellulosilyticaceae bacterium]